MTEILSTGMDSPDSSDQGPLSSKGHVLNVQVNSDKADREVDSTMKHPQDFPEGGLRAWLTVICGYVSRFLRSGVSRLTHIYTHLGPWSRFALLELCNHLASIKITTVSVHSSCLREHDLIRCYVTLSSTANEFDRAQSVTNQFN